MPCISYPHESTSPSTKAFEDQKAELDKVTRLLCQVLSAVESYFPHQELGQVFEDERFTEELVKWWEAHQKWDEERKEKLKKSALSKLTEDEKEALGLG